MRHRRDGDERRERFRSWQAAVAGAVLTGMLTGGIPCAQAEEGSPATATGPAATTAARAGKPISSMKAMNEAASPEVEARMQQVLELFRSMYPEFRSLQIQIKTRGKSLHMGDGQRLEREQWMLAFDERKPGEPKRDDQVSNQVLLQFDETGLLESYRWENRDWAGENLPDKQTALAKATEFLQKLPGADLAQYAPGNVNGEGSNTKFLDEKEVTWVHRSVQFDRQIKGIPMLNGTDMWNVDVDGGGRITGLRRWANKNHPDPALFPDPATALPLEKAKKALEAQQQMALVYLPAEFLTPAPGDVRPLPGRLPLRLVYRPLSFLDLMDAVTGKLPAEFEAARSGDAVETTLRVTGEGKALYAKNAEEGRRVMEKELGVDLTGMTCSDDENEWAQEEKPAPHIRRWEWHDRQFIESLSAENRTRPFILDNASLETESDTGRVCGFSAGYASADGSEGQKGSEKAVISADEAKKTATALLTKHLPMRTVEMKMVAMDQAPRKYPDWVDTAHLPHYAKERPTYDFKFIPLHQGIPIDGFNWSVSVEKATGKVVSFHYHPVDFDKVPSKEGIVSPETAKNAFVKTVNMRLMYHWPQYFNQRAPEPVLVYAQEVHHTGIIDAKTATVVQRLGDD
ncbi:hypothetical protein GTO91_05540 [Heliobacterium undosum]|uniref:YcdB/YcdC repeated domain-containing protein n=1 Tax=Heliomicrobium undosum TaxID=121734 RepID=A0A845KZH8_9FIRM|nr:YcdB/YcdC domain-containing protein [Heliomicrobium undosum]MZP29173.1 hypothetical protein [Heliomicrobium undosum]